LSVVLKEAKSGVLRKILPDGARPNNAKLLESGAAPAAGCTLHGDIEAPRLVVDENVTFFGSAKVAMSK